MGGNCHIRYVTQSIFYSVPSIPSRPLSGWETSSLTTTVNLHASVWFLLGEIASQSQIRNADVSVLVEKDIGWFQVAVDDEPPVHVFQTFTKKKKKEKRKRQNRFKIENKDITDIDTTDE